MLSVVVASRNDNHGGRLVEGIDLFARCLEYGARETGVETELIIVEWNPPFWSKPLSQVLTPPEQSPNFQTHIITVPETLHKKLASSYLMDFYQMIAKNVGIRRAKGDWILCTNPDLVVPLRVFEHVAELEQDEARRAAMYRVLRQDTHGGDVPPNPEEAIEWCKVRCTKLNTSLWEKLHTCACGDFTLLHRDDWFDTRAYPELEIWSIHVDSLFLLFANRVCGLREVLWDDTVVYHPEHANSWIVDPAYGDRFPKLGPNLAPIIQTVDFFTNQGGKHLRWNPETWGYADVDLESVRIC